MEKQRWEESAKRREEERRWEKRQSQKKEDATLTQPLQFRNRAPDKLAPPIHLPGNVFPCKARFVHPLPQKRISRETSVKKWKLKMWKRSFRARRPWKSESGRYENEAFVRDYSFKIWKWKMWKRSFRARPSPQNRKVEDVKTKLACETSFKFWKFKLWKWSLNWQFHCAADPRMMPVQTNVFRSRPLDKLPHLSSGTLFFPCKTAFRASAVSQKRILCEMSLKSWKWKMWKRTFVRDFRQKVKAKDVKTKLSCKTIPSKAESGRCENELSCETSVKKWKPKMWKRSFRARRPWKSESGRCETKLSCETSLKKCKLKMWKRSFPARLFPQKLKAEGVTASFLWDFLAVRSLGCEISWLWDPLAVRSLGCEVSWL